MISSIVWIFLFVNEIITSYVIFWKVYIPIVIVEMLIYIISFPKICDAIDRWKENK